MTWERQGVVRWRALVECPARSPGTGRSRPREHELIELSATGLAGRGQGGAQQAQSAQSLRNATNGAVRDLSALFPGARRSMPGLEARWRYAGGGPGRLTRSTRTGSSDGAIATTEAT